MEQKVQNSVENEQEINTSLTDPCDKNPESDKYKVHRSLTDEEVERAMVSNDNNSFVKNFLKVERKYADPVDATQRIGLFSFLPAKGAKPNEKGIYGFAKLRGNYATDREASEKSEYLIRNVDSYHTIFHTYVGRPFPITTNTNFIDDINKIDIDKSLSESHNEHIKKQKDEEKKQLKEIEERRKALFEEPSRDEDPLEIYTTLKVKKAQLCWRYLELKKEMEKIKKIIIKSRDEIKKMDEEDKSYSENYLQKYNDARSEAGLENIDSNSFGRFLDEDDKGELDF